MRQEQFIRVEGYENYLVSDKGRVYSIFTQKFLALSTDKDGYKRIGLSKLGKQKNFSVHRLVLQSFMPNNEDNIKTNRTQVNHIDETKDNNNLSNLEWVTPKENMNHGTKIQRQMGIENPKARTKKYYSINKTPRGRFKDSCRRKNWDFHDFHEIYSGERTKSNNGLYYYKEK